MPLRKNIPISHNPGWIMPIRNITNYYIINQRRRKVLSKQSIGGANHCPQTIACPSNALSPQNLPTPLSSTSSLSLSLFLSLSLHDLEHCFGNCMCYSLQYLRSCCGSEDKTMDPQSWGPRFKSAGSGRSALGHGTLSSLRSPSERIYSHWSPGCLPISSLLS